MYQDSMILRTTVPLLCALLLALPGGDAAGQPAPDPDVTGSIVGEVVDGETGAPISAAEVRLRGLRRSELSHADGSFHFQRVPAGTYTLTVQRLGYAPAEVTLTVGDDETARPRIEMRRSALEIPGVVVTGVGRERGAGEVYQPTSVLSDAELRRRLSNSIAATIAHEPGIHQQFNGPAASQPVIRGLSGDRVLVLEDGQRTGDMSTTAADHAVAIEPLTAERIEIVRGPAGLLYGSNALGGVINVVREEIPRTLPDRFTGKGSLQAETVNNGFTAGGTGSLPLGAFAVRGELSGRVAGDTRTPLGTLPSTDMRGHNGAVAASRLTGWGHFGVAYRDYALEYGVPGEFEGELIPGAHPGGVDIELSRRTGRLEVGHMAGFGPFSSAELDAGIVHYFHEEIEGTLETGARIVGTRFDQLSGTGNFVLRHEHRNGGFRNEGALGVQYFGRDLIAGGSAPGTRSADEHSLGFFVYEEFGWDGFRLQVGGRYDAAWITPNDDRPIRVGDDVIPVQSRSFGSFSGSVAGLYELPAGVTLGASLSRAFRNPAIEELYSSGPHLADYSYNIGNPALEAEFGLGADVFARLSTETVHGEIAFFRNAIRNYIYYEPTGVLDPRFRRFPVFQAQGDDAVLVGAEGRVQWAVGPRVALDGTASWVRGTLVASDEPLPAIPPLNGSTRVRYDAERFFATAEADFSAAQRRVSPPIAGTGVEQELVLPERPTDGYALLNAGVGYRWSAGNLFHTVTLQASNLTDAVWRDHLSRIKDVAPQPGRNVQLLYRVSF
jgi:iron complex outermembrane recepter protein